MINPDWKQIEEAVKILLSSPAHLKMQGIGWQIYKVGSVIRIDLKDVQN